MDPQALGTQFVQHYYQLFDTNRSQLATLLTDDSMLTYENQQFKGATAIVEKLSGLPRVQHKTSTMDVQPGANSSLVIFVTGVLCIDGNEQQPLSFCEVFTLFQNNGQFFVYNNIFRLNFVG